jgi:hypothetical protein
MRIQRTKSEMESRVRGLLGFLHEMATTHPEKLTVIPQYMITVDLLWDIANKRIEVYENG